MTTRLQISNPKRLRLRVHGKESWFDYYAGYSPQFVADVMHAMELPRNSLVLDPWNGSGTTTATAHEIGTSSIGIDINPVMVVVARAKLLSIGVRDSLIPIADEIIQKANDQPIADAEPLETWFYPKSASAIRSIADGIASLLTNEPASSRLYTPACLSNVSDLAAFYLVALFRATRDFLQPFQASNPTWLKNPSTLRHRLRPTSNQIQLAFHQHISSMATAVTHRDSAPRTAIQLGSSESLPDDITQVDAVISSPPYCTRIDYAIATKPELAILGCPLTAEFTELRRRIIGAPVITRLQPTPLPTWGPSCLAFLDTVESHPSKGSVSYYHKMFLQYFGAMHSSLVEINRVLRPGAQCVLVVQDSHYKSERIDIATYLIQMSSSLGWKLRHRFDFEAALLMSRMNTRSTKYRAKSSATESVLWFEAA